MSFCMRCRHHATFNHTVFQGTAATTVKLCDDCAAAIDANGHIDNIKAAPDKDAKKAAVSAFIAACETPAAGGAQAEQPTA